MRIFRKSADLVEFLRANHANGLRLGFVPTMGALHTGHISLVSNSMEQNELTICSIFVNPTQFNNPEDLAKYPVTIEKDIDMLEASGCQLLFLPDPSQIYPAGYQARHYDLGNLETILEGKYRPGHFQGVCQVVDRLLSIVNPDILYLGRKDYQQCMVIARMLTLTGRNITLDFVETMREPDGLAMSSRNVRLNESDRVRAIQIYRSLQWLKKNVKPGNLSPLKAEAVQQLTDHGFEVDYVEIASAESLSITENWDGRESLVALAAAFCGPVRLIDNVTLS